MDFLKNFGDGRTFKGENLDEENVELSLGLSSNGRFGVDLRRTVANDISGEKNRLIRSSSIAGFSSETDDPTSLTLYPPLTRTCSLPIETEAEWKKRKELQSLRRSAAKRKRVEKLKNGGRRPEENYETKMSNSVNGNEFGRLLPPLPRPSVVPAIGSPASGGSSGVSDLESQPVSGTNKDTELKSTASHQTVSRQIPSSSIYRSNSIASLTTSTQTNRNLSKDETLRMMFADMPCVSTKGEGINGKRIEGFLYRYQKGEEVRIVCVCHGSFLTPADFVRHGGGGDVEHPLRHIVVMPPPSL